MQTWSPKNRRRELIVIVFASTYTLCKQQPPSEGITCKHLHIKCQDARDAGQLLGVYDFLMGWGWWVCLAAIFLSCRRKTTGLRGSWIDSVINPINHWRADGFSYMRQFIRFSRLSLLFADAHGGGEGSRHSQRCKHVRRRQFCRVNGCESSMWQRCDASLHCLCFIYFWKCCSL